MTIEITKISAALTNYINVNYGNDWSVVRINQDDNEIIIKFDDVTNEASFVEVRGFMQDFWLVDPNGRWTYTNEELKEMKAEEIQELKEQYDHQVRYYEECCNDDDCDGQDREEAYSEMTTAYELWQEAK